MTALAHRVGVVVAVLLIAHVWMLQASGHVSHEPPHEVAVASTDLLPAAGGCPAGMTACLAPAPDDASVVLGAAALVGLLALTAVGSRTTGSTPHVHRVRREYGHPPRPHAASSVVLLQ